VSIKPLFELVAQLNHAREETQRLEAVLTMKLRRARQALLVTDQDGVIFFPNEAARALFSAVADPLVGVRVTALVAKDDAAALEELLNAALTQRQRVHSAQVRPAKGRKRLSVFSRLLNALGGHRPAVVWYWRSGALTAADRERLLSAPQRPYRSSIPLDRRVVGADLAHLEQKLGLNALQMIDLFAVPPNKYYAMRRAAEEPIEDGAVARLVRLLDAFPELVESEYTLGYLRELLATLYRRPWILAEMGLLLGRNISSVSRYGADEQRHRTVQRLTALLCQLLETQPIEAFEFYEALAAAEQTLRDG
jgi:PAS domain S-box-containing protein